MTLEVDNLYIGKSTSKVVHACVYRPCVWAFVCLSEI